MFIVALIFDIELLLCVLKFVYVMLYLNCNWIVLLGVKLKYLFMFFVLKLECFMKMVGFKSMRRMSRSVNDGCIGVLYINLFLGWFVIFIFIGFNIVKYLDVEFFILFCIMFLRRLMGCVLSWRVISSDA